MKLASRVSLLELGLTLAPELTVLGFAGLASGEAVAKSPGAIFENERRFGLAALQLVSLGEGIACLSLAIPLAHSLFADLAWLLISQGPGAKSAVELVRCAVHSRWESGRRSRGLGGHGLRWRSGWRGWFFRVDFISLHPALEVLASVALRPNRGVGLAPVRSADREHVALATRPAGHAELLALAVPVELEAGVACGCLAAS